MYVNENNEYRVLKVGADAVNTNRNGLSNGINHLDDFPSQVFDSLIGGCSVA